MIQNRNNNWRAMTLSKAEGIGSTAQGRNSLFLVAGGKEGRDLSKRSDLVVGVHRILFWWLLFSQRNNKQYFWTTFSVKEMLENWARKKSKTAKKVRQWLDCRRGQHRASSGSAAESLKWGQLAGLFSSICLQLGRCRCRVEGDLGRTGERAGITGRRLLWSMSEREVVMLKSEAKLGHKGWGWIWRTSLGKWWNWLKGWILEQEENGGIEDHSQIWGLKTDGLLASLVVLAMEWRSLFPL